MRYGQMCIGIADAPVNDTMNSISLSTHLMANFGASAPPFGAGEDFA